jgi:hypothetical protein
MKKDKKYRLHVQRKAVENDIGCHYFQPVVAFLQQDRQLNGRNQPKRYKRNCVRQQSRNLKTLLYAYANSIRRLPHAYYSRMARLHACA